MDGEEGNMVVTRDEQVERNSAETSAALQQCQLLQNIIDITISNLQGLRTKCAASNDLTQLEIRTLEVTLHTHTHARPPIAVHEEQRINMSLSSDLHTLGVSDMAKISHHRDTI